ncbi:hypothetical protein [Azospirillum aestuarii]|uniref:hypothetical protein n=1 Tax=Azospirillum aestuarii TaxID=2802052 RepID=UPI004054FBDF
MERVRAYCESDVLTLYAAYVRWTLLTGRTDPAGHNASVDSLVECLAHERATHPHLGIFLDRWQASTRPAPMHVSVPRPAPVAEPPHLPSEHVL